MKIALDTLEYRRASCRPQLRGVRRKWCSKVAREWSSARVKVG